MSEFDAIYAAHAAAVFRVALRAVGRRDVAEDIVSEVFLALHRNMPSIDREQLRPGSSRWLDTARSITGGTRTSNGAISSRCQPPETTWEPSIECGWRRQGAQGGPSRLPHPALRAWDGTLGDREAARAHAESGEGLSAVRADHPAPGTGEGAVTTSVCPPPELVQASKEGVLPPDLQARVSRHVAECPICQALNEALDAPDVGAMTPDEHQRILARVHAGIAVTRRPRSPTAIGRRGGRRCPMMGWFRANHGAVCHRRFS